MQEHASKVRATDLNQSTQNPPHKNTKQKTFFEKLVSLISPEPHNREALLDILHDAQERGLIDADALAMIEGVFQVSDLCASDIMVPRAQMDVVDISQPIDTWIPQVMETAHSRFPVVDGDKEHIIGILLAKDILRYYVKDDFDVRKMLRPVVYIPESKRLNVLLRDFRSNRNHMAMVVDEYGAVAGLITIEDVLEQIVGDIDDEHDFDEEEGNIISIENLGNGKRWRVKGVAEIAHFNEEIGAGLPQKMTNEETGQTIKFETLGDYIMYHLQDMPHKGDTFDIDNLNFEILRADGREVQVILVEKRSAVYNSEE